LTSSINLPVWTSSSISNSSIELSSNESSVHLEQPASYIACPAAAEIRIVAELPTQTACSLQASSTTPWTLDWQKLCYAITVQSHLL